MHCLFFFLVFVMQQKIKRFCIFLFFILTTMLTAQIPVFAEADTDSKDAGLAEYYDTQLNLPKNQVVKARVIMMTSRKAGRMCRLNPTSDISI